MRNRTPKLLALALAAVMTMGMTVSADTIEENPWWQIMDISSGDTLNYNRGTVGSNSGTVEHNYGIVTTNNSTVNYNYETVKQTGKIVVKFQRRGKPTNSALLESHYQSEHLQDIGMSRPICCYTSK